jgi:hypothetical protein
MMWEPESREEDWFENQDEECDGYDCDDCDDFDCYRNEMRYDHD